VGLAELGRDINPKPRVIKAPVFDASQKLNYAINNQNDALQRNFVSSFLSLWQSSVVN
jgi:hypothetical protein